MTELARGTSQNSENSQNVSAIDYATWLTKQQAADAIGVSTKTIEQFAKDRKIQQAAWRPQGRGAERAVYNPDDVARMVQERRGAPAPFVLPVGVTSPVNGNGQGKAKALQLAAASSPTGEDVLRLVFAAALQRLTADPTQTSENSQKLFLTIPEAAAYAGLPATDIRRACASGELPARQTGRGGWRIRRKDLEAF